MLLIGLNNGLINEFDFENPKKNKKLSLNYKFDLGDNEIIKILSLRKKHIVAGSKKNGIKFFKKEESKYYNFLKNPIPDMKDFTFFNSYCFTVFDNLIYVWKKFSTTNWKILGKIKLRNDVDRIHIGKTSKIMLSMSFLGYKIDLWKFLDRKIFFCGSSIIREKIAAFGDFPRNNNFAIGTNKGNLYIYTDTGLLSAKIKQLKPQKTDSITSKPYPLKFFDQNLVFSGGYSNQLCQWDIRTKKIVKYWQGHVGQIKNIDCFYPENIKNPFVFVSSDSINVIKIWDIRKENEIFSLNYFSNPIDVLKIL
jgi:WD40 repeat protein